MSEEITNELTDSDLSQVIGGSSTSVTTQLSAVTAFNLLGTMPIGVTHLAPKQAATEAGTLYTAVVAFAQQQNVPVDNVAGALTDGQLFANMTTTTDGANTSYSCTLQVNANYEYSPQAPVQAPNTQAAQPAPGVA